MTEQITPAGQNKFDTRLLKKTDGRVPVIIGKEEVTEKEEDDDKKDKRLLLCKFCKNKITSRENAIEINGSHKHTFFNPSGIVFEIGCFAQAFGCANRGSPTLEFTWFSGYSWRFSMCGKCLMQLGWQYQSMDGKGFYGLILDNLIEEKTKE